MDNGLNKRPTVVSWYDLKACMRSRFVPPPYRKEDLLKFQRLHQGHRMVDAYFKDVETTLTRMNIHDNEESKIKRFVSCLRKEIKDLVELYEYYSLKKVVHLAIKVESHLLKETTFKNTHDDGFYKFSWKDTNENFTKITPSTFSKDTTSNSSRKDANKISKQNSPSNFSKQTTSSQKVSTQNPSTPKSPNKTSKPKCFKCLCFGHIAATYPNKQTIMLNMVKQAQLNLNSKIENEREKEGQDTMSLIPSPPRCFSSLSFSLHKNSKYLTFFKKFRDAIPNHPKGSHLLRDFFTKYFIPKSSFQTCVVARTHTYHLPRFDENKFASPLHSPTNVNKLTTLFAGLLNLWTNSFAPGEHDSNPKMIKDTTSKIQKGQSCQNTKLRLTKHKDNISRRRSHEPKHLKFFLLVFLSVEEML